MGKELGNGETLVKDPSLHAEQRPFFSKQVTHVPSSRLSVCPLWLPLPARSTPLSV